jgi:hypothetical protein
MLARIAAVVLCGLMTFSVGAAELRPDEARHFIVGKLFAFTCFDGTHGAGRIRGDGSVAGTIQFGGSSAVRYASLPPGTLRVNGEKVCASLRGISFEPCFNLEKIDARSFRGSVAGMNFAYCDFTRRGGGRADLTAATPRHPIQSATVVAHE